jgi:hypothetical protein
MAMHVVMDHAGDRRHYFDKEDAESLAEAERRFHELVGRGFTAAARVGPGEVSKIHAFDPAIEETLFVPRLVGG